MAVEAAINCMKAAPGLEVDGLYFASTNAPYVEKSTSSLIATVCDLNDEIITNDFANSLRAGTGALRSALDAVQAGTVSKNIVVTAADCRLAYPRSDHEQLFGDGAAAVAVGSKNVMASLEWYYSINNEIVDVWRNPRDTYVNFGEGRLIMDEGYNPCMKKAVEGVLAKSGLKPDAFKKIVLTTPDMRAYTNIAKKAGFAHEQVQEALMSQVGNCGTAQPLMLLVAALEDAAPGDLILLAAYSNGAEAFIFKVTDEIKKLQAKKTIKTQIDTKMLLPSYDKYLSYRGLVDVQPGEPFRLFPSNSVYWREQKSILRFHGSKCNQCGKSIFPMQRICYSCQSKDDFTEISCAGKTAKMFTYTIDYLGGRSDDPLVIQSVVDADDGTRFYLLMTDFQREEIAIDMEVEFTFRKIYEGANFNNYFWKCRPVRFK